MTLISCALRVSSGPCIYKNERPWRRNWWQMDKLDDIEYEVKRLQMNVDAMIDMQGRMHFMLKEICKVMRVPTGPLVVSAVTDTTSNVIQLPKKEKKDDRE